MADRPLSPHLSIWRWGPHMAVSILNRITGDGLAFVGLPVLLWWLGALASGPRAYETFVFAADNPLGYIVLVGLSWAFFNHLVAGIRHWVMDIGAGFEIHTNKTWSVISLVAPVILTAAFWAAIVLR